MTTNYDIRPWQSGDETAIFALFEASFGRQMSPEFWRWRFQDHPAGGPLVMLAWAGDRLAAHYGASQAPLSQGDQSQPAALSMTTMTHPDDRGRGLVETVGGALYETLRADGYTTVWGFPNAMINATRQRKLAWEPICDVVTLSRVIANARPIPTDPALVVSVVGAIDDRFGALRADLCEPDTVSGARDTATLQWRIDANPINSYTRYVIAAGTRITGYAITKTYQDHAIDMVDLCAVDAPHISALMARIDADAQARGVAQMNTWCLHRDPARITLERLGFAATAPVTYLGGRSFHHGLGDIWDMRRWRLSMIDSDLY